MASEAEKTETVIAYKGFDKNLQCRGFQYELGKTFDHTGPVIRCGAGGFHSCENPFDVFRYYKPVDGNRFGVVTAGGKVERDASDSKIASGRITIEAELKLPELLAKGAAWLLGRSEKQRQETMKVAQEKSTATTG
jgi:hypothetical protein